MTPPQPGESHDCKTAWLVAVLAFGVVLGGGGVIRAEVGTTRATTGFGLKIAFDTRWVSGAGYHPVRVDVTPMVPVVADRTLTVECLSKSWWQRNEDRVVQTIEIPAGTNKPIQTTISLPRADLYHSLQVHVLEDGIVRWSASLGSLQNPGNPMRPLTVPAVLIVGPSNQMNIFSETDASASSVTSFQSGNIQTYTSGDSQNSFTIRAANELPERWIDYSNLDMICLSLEQLDGLARSRPKVFQAIVEWTATGGNLCVSQVGPRWKRLGELESLLEIGPGRTDTESSPPVRGWHLPSTALFGKPLRDNAEWSNATDYNNGWTDTVEETPLSRSSPKPPKAPHFVFREFQQGMIVVMAADAFPTRHEWEWVLQTLGPNRLLWDKRHGLSSFGENPGFWKFLIPGVGLVPVTAFRVFLTLFVLAIGPLNYWLLRRSKRLHWLVVTIPASAAMVTFLLFGYAMLADGFATRVRVRSVTQIDQSSGRAVCWSRLSYYAGLTPTGGLVFSDDVVVIPLKYQSVRRSTPDHELVWEGDQRLVSGWLAARTPTQFITVRSRPSQYGLEIAEPDASGKELSIENRLEADIEQLLVRSKDGQYWWATNVAKGATIRAKSVDPTVAWPSLLQESREHMPSYPPDVDPSDWSGGMFYGNPYYYYNQGSVQPTQATSRLEQSIFLTNGGFDKALKPGNYLAIVNQSPEVLLGTPSAREEASFHLIHGTW